MALLEQIFFAAVSIICFLLRYYFKDLSKKKNYSERKKSELISVLMTIATVAGVFLTGSLIINQIVDTGETGIEFIKLFVLFLIMAEIVNYKSDELLDGLAQFLAILISALIAGGFWGVGLFELESNIVKAEKQKYYQEQFELVEIFDDTKPDSSINVQTSISKYFKYEVEEVEKVEENQNSESSEEENKTSKTKQTCEICYIDKSEEKQQICKKIDFDDTVLKPVLEGQKPYMIVKTYTSYSINNNVDPPEECDFENSYKYELYVPEEDIKELSKLLK